MKKIIILLISTFFMLTACSTSDSSDEKENNNSTENQTSQTNINETKDNDISEIKLQEFASSLYEANKRSDIEHFDELTDDNIKSVINRRFMGANTENSKDYEKSVSNTKIYQSLNDENDYVVTLEVKYTNHKEKNITWLKKTLNFKIKAGKIIDFREIGEKEIFNEE